MSGFKRYTEWDFKAWAGFNVLKPLKKLRLKAGVLFLMLDILKEWRHYGILPTACDQQNTLGAYSDTKH